MWTHEYSTTTPASPKAVWTILADVAGWGAWNDGIESIELDGPVAVGVGFRMTPPGADTLHSTVVDLQPGRVLTDLTELDGIAVRVEHRIEPHPDGTSVTYRIEVSGSISDDVAGQIGGAISADFPDVIANLVARAESATSPVA